MQRFAGLILRLKPPRCPSSSCQLTVVVVQGVELALVNCQPGSHKQPLVAVDFLLALPWAAVSAGVLGAGGCWGETLSVANSDSSPFIFIAVRTILAALLDINTA